MEVKLVYFTDLPPEHFKAHLNYSFTIHGISRALLQELARHRTSSLSVKSTRYTLKELKKAEPFSWIHGSAAIKKRALQFLVPSGESLVDIASIKALEELRRVLVSGVSNDRAKYCLPEAYKTGLTWTTNAANLQNFLSLRINHRHALWEIVQLAENIALALPNSHKYLYSDTVNEFASPEFKEVFNKTTTIKDTQW